jgi:hypothetical protein
MSLRTKVAVSSGLVLSAAVSAACLVIAPAALAGQPVTVPLNPAPPSFETCMTVGNGITCQGSRVEDLGEQDSGIVCGSGAGTFDPIDHAIDHQHAIRFYDTNGYLLRRVIFDHLVGAITNPLTGTSVSYNAHNTTTDVLAVPGDFSSATTTGRGEQNYTVPGMGLVFQNAGRATFDANGDIESMSGHQDFASYFSGDTAVADELCAALGA